MRLLARLSAVLLCVLFVSGVGRADESSRLQDLDALVNGLVERHPDAFRYVQEEDFRRQVSRLRSQAGGLEEIPFNLEMQRLTALLGDGHTSLLLDPSKMRHLPFALLRFGRELVVSSTAPGWEGLLGARLVSLGGVPTETVFRKVEPFVAHDNETQFFYRRGLYWVCEADLLAYLGVWNSPEKGVATFEIDGRTVQKTVATVPTASFMQDWVSLDRPPAFERSEEVFWWERLSGRSGDWVYLAYNKCVKDSNAYLPELNRMVAEIQSHQNQIQGIVVDLRHNPGGSSYGFHELFLFLGSSAYNRTGKLFLMVGPETFSSGMYAAADLRSLNAVQLGQPTGGRPDHFGEVESFQLPNSKQTVVHSTREWKLIYDEQVDAFYPHVLVEPTLEDWLQQRDTVLESIVQPSRS